MGDDDKDILYFQLSDEGLKNKVRGGEKIVGYSILVIGFLAAYRLYVSQVAFRWWYLIIGVILLWLAIEVGTYLIRRQRLKRWSNYKLGYENDVIFELRNNEKTAEVFRDRVTSLENVRSGIKVSSWKDRLIAPYDLIDFDQLEVRLENWRPPGSSPDARRRKRNMEMKPKGEVTVTFGGIRLDSAPDNRRQKPTYQQTRMNEVRQARTKRKFDSLVEFVRRKRR